MGSVQGLQYTADYSSVGGKPRKLKASTAERCRIERGVQQERERERASVHERWYLLYRLPRGYHVHKQCLVVQAHVVVNVMSRATYFRATWVNQRGTSAVFQEHVGCLGDT